MDFTVYADVFQHTIALPVAHRHNRGRVQRLPDGNSRFTVVQRPGADSVNHHWNIQLMSHQHFPEINLGLAIEEDSSSAQNEKIEPPNLGSNLLSSQFPNGHGSLHVVPAESVRRIPSEYGNFHRQGGPQLGDDTVENSLISQIHAAIGSRNADVEDALHWRFPVSLLPPVRFKRWLDIITQA